MECGATILCGFFAGWFGLLTLLGLDSQFGRTRPRSLPPSPDLAPSSITPADEGKAAAERGGLAMPTAYLHAHAPEEPSGAAGLQRVESEEHVPMRVDSFGDMVPIGEADSD